MKIIANEKENIRKILLGKESDIEKKTREINQLTQVKKHSSLIYISNFIGSRRKNT